MHIYILTSTGDHNTQYTIHFKNSKLGFWIQKIWFFFFLKWKERTNNLRHLVWHYLMRLSLFKRILLHHNISDWEYYQDDSDPQQITYVTIENRSIALVIDERKTPYLYFEKKYFNIYWLKSSADHARSIRNKISNVSIERNVFRSFDRSRDRRESYSVTQSIILYWLKSSADHARSTRNKISNAILIRTHTNHRPYDWK